MPLRIKHIIICLLTMLAIAIAATCLQVAFADQRPAKLVIDRPVVDAPLEFYGNLRTGDLLFQASQEGAFNNAISQATGYGSVPTYTHVAIFAIIDSMPMVIEATPRKGVAFTPLHEFMAEAEAEDCVVTAKRIVFGNIDCAAAVERAKDFVGLPYDWEFDAANDKIYCSELVQHSYLNADGTMLFQSVPMNFKDSNGEMPQFWTDLFRQLGKPIPQGEPGTNPNALSASPLLLPIE